MFPPLLPHPRPLPATARSNASIPRRVRQVRRRAGVPKNRSPARTAPPAGSHGIPLCFGSVMAVVGAVVVIVSAAVLLGVPVTVTGLVEPKLKVGTRVAPAGVVVMAAARVTLPVKPPDGVTVMVEVLFALAPAAKSTDVAPIVKPGGGGDVTITVAVPVALLYGEPPPGVGV